MTPTTPDHKPAPATDEEIAEWNPADRNIAAAVYPWKVAKLIARISADRAELAAIKAQAEARVKVLEDRIAQFAVLPGGHFARNSEQYSNARGWLEREGAAILATRKKEESRG